MLPIPQCMCYICVNRRIAEARIEQKKNIAKKEESVTKLNTPWVVTVEAPLLRPGLKLTVGPVSEKYVVEETLKAMEKVREINQGKQDVNQS